MTGLVLSPASRRRCSATVGCTEQPLEVEKPLPASIRAGGWRDDGTRGGRRSLALARALGRRSSTRLGTHCQCQKHRSAPRGTASNQEVARVQQGTIGRTRQNTHRTINPPAPGPRTSPRLCRARRGLFRGERLSPRWPWLCLPQQGLAGFDRIPGLNRPPDLRRALNSCGFAGVDGK